jgi:hypothetical protein
MAKYEKRDRAAFVINFDEPVTESVIGGNALKTKKISIAKIIDNPGTKTVAVMTLKNKLYVLWRFFIARCQFTIGCSSYIYDRCVYDHQWLL